MGSPNVPLENGGGGWASSSSEDWRLDVSRRSGGADNEGCKRLWCMNSAEGAMRRLDLRFRQKRNAPTRRAMRMTAPMTPPAMGPALLFDLTKARSEALGALELDGASRSGFENCVGVEVGVESKGGGDVAATATLEKSELKAFESVGVALGVPGGSASVGSVELDGNVSALSGWAPRERLQHRPTKDLNEQSSKWNRRNKTLNERQRPHSGQISSQSQFSIC